MLLSGVIDEESVGFADLIRLMIVLLKRCDLLVVYVWCMFYVMFPLLFCYLFWLLCVGKPVSFAGGLVSH